MYKTITLSVAMFFALNYAANAQTPSIPIDGPKISFETGEHNFGTIYEGDVAEYQFVFTNTGNQPLTISKVRSSCGCTTPELSQETVLPGKKAYVKTRYNTQNVGAFSKTVTVTSNAVDNPRVVLKIKGNVKQRYNIEKNNGKFGIVDDITNTTTIPFIYDTLIIVKEDECVVAIKNGMCGIINYSNQVIIPLVYQNIITYKRIDDRLMVWGYDGYANVKKNGKWGAIDKNNRIGGFYKLNN